LNIILLLLKNYHLLQGNIDNPPPPILLIFGYVVAYRKIRNTYFFFMGEAI